MSQGKERKINLSKERSGAWSILSRTLERQASQADSETEQQYKTELARAANERAQDRTSPGEVCVGIEPTGYKEVEGRLVAEYESGSFRKAFVLGEDDGVWRDAPGLFNRLGRALSRAEAEAEFPEADITALSRRLSFEPTKEVE